MSLHARSHLGGLALGLAALAAACQPPSTPRAEPGVGGIASIRRILLSEAFFARTDVPRLALRVSEEDMDKLRQNRRTNVPARVRDGARTYGDVAMHLKGGKGSLRPLDDKPSITLNFDKLVPGQQLWTLDKVHLNNAVEDPSYCREILANRVFRRAGVPAPRAALARVSLNGRDLGLYVLTEGIDRAFLKLYFTDAGGAVYDSGTVHDIDVLEPLPSERPTIAGDLAAVWRAAHEEDPERRLERLGEVLDLDRFISFIAAEALLGHWDGYATNSNNYRLYYDPASARFVFLPGHADESFDEDGDLYPGSGGEVAELLVDTREGLARYEARLRELFDTIWRDEGLERSVRELADFARQALTEEERERHDEAVGELLDAIAARRERFVDHFEVLAGVETFEVGESRLLTGWKPTAGGDSPAEGLLRLRADGRRKKFVWYTRMTLSRGRYRFEGRVSTAGVPDLPGKGAYLAAGRMHSAEPVTGDTASRPISIEIDVSTRMMEAILTCSLESLAGEAVFERGSLRLVRLPDESKAEGASAP